MQTGTAEAVENACLALGNLSLIEANEKRILHNVQVVDNLVAVLNNSTELAKDAACKVVAKNAGPGHSADRTRHLAR